VYFKESKLFLLAGMFAYFIKIVLYKRTFYITLVYLAE